MANDMTKPNQPEFLYKYRHLEGEHREWTKRIITDSEFYYAKPSEFNDPFDCNIPENYFIPRTENKKREIKKWHKEFLEEKYPNMSRQAIRKKAREIYKSSNPREVINKMQEATYNLGVFCLAEENDNILLRSHYANSHRGLCLKFSLSGEML